MKKLLLIIVGVLTALPTLAYDFMYTYKGQKLGYTVLDREAKTCMVDLLYQTSQTDLEIPENVTDGVYNYAVTAIAERAFKDQRGLTSVIIPNSVTSIGDFAFYGCSSLTTISIPNSVTSLGMYAFAECSGLTSLSIPNSVTSIGNFAFHGCNNIESLSIDSENLRWGVLTS